MGSSTQISAFQRILLRLAMTDERIDQSALQSAFGMAYALYPLPLATSQALGG